MSDSKIVTLNQILKNGFTKLEGGSMTMAFINVSDLINRDVDVKPTSGFIIIMADIIGKKTWKKIDGGNERFNESELQLMKENFKRKLNEDNLTYNGKDVINQLSSSEFKKVHEEFGSCAEVINRFINTGLKIINGDADLNNEDDEDKNEKSWFETYLDEHNISYSSLKEEKNEIVKNKSIDKFHDEIYLGRKFRMWLYNMRNYKPDYDKTDDLDWIMSYLQQNKMSFYDLHKEKDKRVEGKSKIDFYEDIRESDKYKEWLNEAINMEYPCDSDNEEDNKSYTNISDNEEEEDESKDIAHDWKTHKCNKCDKKRIEHFMLSDKPKESVGLEVSRSSSKDNKEVKEVKDKKGKRKNIDKNIDDYSIMDKLKLNDDELYDLLLKEHQKKGDKSLPPERKPKEGVRKDCGEFKKEKVGKIQPSCCDKEGMRCLKCYDRVKGRVSTNNTRKKAKINKSN